MATVSAVVYDHHEKTDKTINVKIRVYHKDEKKFIDTTHYVTRKQLDKDFKIKDKFLLKILDDTLDDYRKTISEIGTKLNFFSCEDLRDHLRDKDSDVDFIKFSRKHIKNLKEAGRTGTASNQTTVVNSLCDYFKRESISINEIHFNMLTIYEKWLRKDRIMVRINQLGKSVETTEKGLKDSGIHNHMRDLRTLFNEARRLYNNEDLGIIKIKHYPFKKYKVGSPPLTVKRNNTIEEVRIIRDCIIEPGSRAELARDLYILSFYMCGINAVDLYKGTFKNIRNGRLDYNRSKTEAGRKDNAFISIKIVDEAKPLLEKYLEKLSIRYANHEGLDYALSKGMEHLRKITGIPDITLYWARHTFGNLARNSCRMSKDDVGLALNHIDEGHRTTDIYIAKDWTIVDEVQNKVVTLLRKLDIKEAEKARKQLNAKQAA